MKLILIRHGETIENKKHITQGHTPGTLSKKGKEQAKLLAKRLSDIKIDVIYTSDLRRAENTARIIAEHHPEAKFVAEKRLREKSHGIYDGKHRDIVFKKVWQRCDFGYRPPKGESFEEVRKRLEDFYKEILRKYDKETVLVVSHGGSIILLTGIIFGKSLKDSVNLEVQKNTALTEFEIDKKGRFKTLCFNCDKHL